MNTISDNCGLKNSLEKLLSFSLFREYIIASYIKGEDNVRKARLDLKDIVVIVLGSRSSLERIDFRKGKFR